jgi:DNA-binding transcriptional regulator PaaX
MSQYKYYAKKPKVEITKDILTWIGVGGAIVVAASSPYFSTNLIRTFRSKKHYGKKKFYDTFSRLRREGYVRVEKHNHQMYISLTEEGKKKAGRFQINNLTIKKPKQWDGYWRIIIFDIIQSQRIKREALRGLLKRFDLYPLQKSVWAHPYNCKDEIGLLRPFFGLKEDELRIIIAKDIGNDREIRKYFKI